MIPEYEHISVGGVIAVGIVDELGKGLRIRHGLGTHVILETLKFAVTKNSVDLVYGGRNGTVLPLFASAGINDDVYIVGKSGISHLHKVIGSHAGPGFKIGTAQIDHYGHHILTISKDGGIFISCFGGYGTIQNAYILIGSPGR